jgi:hypothetical protein
LAGPISGDFLRTTGDISLSGTGGRILGDFSNATHVNRVAFQSSTTNGATSVFTIPNGTSTTANLVVANASNPTNSSFGQFLVNSTDVRIFSGLLGTGSYLPMTFYTGGSEAMRIDTSRNVSIGDTSSGGYKLKVAGSTNTTYIKIKQGTSDTFTGMGIAAIYNATSADGYSYIDFQGRNDVSDSSMIVGHRSDYSSYIQFSTQPAGTNTDRRVTRLTLDSEASFSCNINVGSGQTNSTISMQDSDEGTRQMHCNSNRIGFLNQSGGWGSYCTDDGSWATDGNLFFNSGFGSAGQAYGCRAWANFAGNGSTGTNQTIRGSGNITTIAHPSSGIYTANFATAMPDTNYNFVAAAMNATTAAAASNDSVGPYGYATGSITFQNTDATSNSFQNPVFMNFSIFR